MASTDNPIVALDGLGELEGAFCPNSHEIVRFLDVPYAAPPVGEMRWRAPAQPEPWNGVRSNPSVLTRCPQPSIGPATTFAGHTLVDDEDCLKCAIWAPVDAIRAAAQAEELAQIAAFDVAGAAAEAAAEQSERGDGESDGRVFDDSIQLEPQVSEANAALLPVIVYIHGGGGKLGTCHTDVHGGEALARTQKVVFVAINYRLGILGFLAHPALTSEDASSSLACCGNYAIADQIAALVWVQQHIHCFGGDKSKVTVMGYSSGAQFVSTLIVSPLTGHPQWGMGADSRPKGLFHRAVIQSCVDLPNVRKLQSSCEVWQGKSAEEWGEKLAEGMKCPTEEDAEFADSWDTGQLASLRKLPVETIVEHTFDQAATDAYESVIDARGARWGGAMACLKPMSSLEAFETGAFHRVPMMIGATEQDGLGKAELELIQFDDVTDSAELVALFEKTFGEHATQALKLYYTKDANVSEAEAVAASLARLGGELWYQGGSWHMANIISAAAAAPPVYLYSFAEKVSTGAGREARSFHGSDVTFWHASCSSEPGHSHPDPAATALGAAMLTYLGNFARTGDPNCGSNGGQSLQSAVCNIGSHKRSQTRLVLPEWTRHTSRAERLMVLGSIGDSACASGEMRSLAPDVLSRFCLLADEYFAKVVPRQLAEGQYAPDPQQVVRRSGGWTGRRRQRL